MSVRKQKTTFDKILCILTLCVYLFAPTLSAQEVDSQDTTTFLLDSGIKILEIRASDPSYKEGAYLMDNYLYIVPDSAGAWTIEEVSAATFADRFVNGKAEELRKAHPDVAWFWVRLSIRSHLQRSEEWLVNFAQPEVTLFESQTAGGFLKKRSGTYVPFSQRSFQGQYGSLPLLPFYLVAGSTQTYYLKLKAADIFAKPYWSELDGILASPEYIADFSVAYRNRHSFLLGLMFTVGLYHLIFFFYYQARSYLYFGLYALSHVLLATYFKGYALEYWVPEHPALNNDFLFFISVSAYLIFLIIFSSSYLRLKQLAPKWDRFLNLLIFVQLIYSFDMILMRLFNPAWFQNNAVFFMEFYTLLLGPVHLLILILAILSLRKGYQPAFTFLIAIGISVFQQMLNVIVGSGILRFEIPEIMRGELGSAVGMLIFAIGIGQQLKTIQEEKIKAETIQKQEQEESQRLRELDEFKTRFYTNITHEFRTPLTVIQGLADQIGENPRWKTQEKIGLIKNNSQQLLQLINQMLDLSKLEAGKLEPEYVQGDIIKYLSYQVESFHSLAHSQNITLSFHAPVKSLVMDYDPDKFRQIIGNLISNAIKFTPEYGSVKVAAKVLAGNDSTRQLEIEVKDTGVGIPPEKHSFIFDRFYQADNSSIRKADGTGLGLSLTKELLNLMDGSIQVQSEVGKGSTFICRMPIRNEAKITSLEPISQPAVPAGGNTFATSGTELENGDHGTLPIILIVEDNQDVIYYLRDCLEEQYQILEAKNGREGMSKAFEHIPDLVISDVMMPEMDGFELCRTLKTDERSSHIPIILLTAKVTQADKMEGLTQGADAYLAKPFQKEELLIRLNNLLELRRQMQQKYQSAESDDNAPEDPFLQKTRQLIEDHLDDPDFGVMPLSRALGMSRVQVHRKLKALTDVSTSQYIRNTRLQKAYELLKDSTLTISEVAYRVGFKDPAHFSRSFSQQFGVPPSELRR